MNSDTKWLRVTCRLCGKVMLFPKGFYKEKDFIEWECRGSLSKECKDAYERSRQ